MAYPAHKHVVTVRTMASVTSRMASVPPAVHQGIMEEYVKMPVVTVRQGQYVRMWMDYVLGAVLAMRKTCVTKVFIYISSSNT